MNIKEFLALHAKRHANVESQNPNQSQKPKLESTKEKQDSAETFSMDIELDADQEEAVALALAGKSFCIIGKAGTGKTTSERAIIKAILSRMPEHATHLFRIQGTPEKRNGPAAAVVAYTRIASANSRKAICKDPELEEKFFHNITTIHNLLEFQPEFFYDSDKEKDSMRFVPMRHRGNPLNVKTITFEESSMIDLLLWEKIYDAMQSGTQCIFVGDINQLPPVFGPSILNYALTQLPIVELKTVYRQKFNSTVLLNAHNILEGKPVIEADDFKIIEGGDKQHGQATMAMLFANTLKKWLETGEYNPETDIVLTPFNKQELGSDSLNSYIAGFLNQSDVWEVYAGIRKLYLAIGDKIMYNKQVGVITKISHNGMYMGKRPRPHSKHMSRFGILSQEIDLDLAEGEETDEDYVHVNLEQLDKAELEELSRQSSHVVHIQLETGEDLALQKVGDLTAQVFSLAYALTVHKAQGCEWRRVFIVLHKDHSIMAYNELLYTAVTRASESVVMIAKKFMIEKAIKTRRLKGNSIKEKIEYFNANMQLSSVNCVKP